MGSFTTMKNPPGVLLYKISEYAGTETVWLMETFCKSIQWNYEKIKRILDVINQARSFSGSDEFLGI